MNRRNFIKKTILGTITGFIAPELLAKEKVDTLRDEGYAQIDTGYTYIAPLSNMDSTTDYPYVMDEETRLKIKNGGWYE